jgi:hypothetical protein
MNPVKHLLNYIDRIYHNENIPYRSTIGWFKPPHTAIKIVADLVLNEVIIDSYLNETDK